MVIKIAQSGDMYCIDNDEDSPCYDLCLSKEEFLDLYRQMTKIMVDEVVRDYDPDKPRKGFGGSEEHKKKKKEHINTGSYPFPVRL